jgi:hypothetical protein
MLLKLSFFVEYHKAFYMPPLLVISALRAIMACLILVTSLPPTYEFAFISQLSITLTQGLDCFLDASKLEL